MACHTKLRCTRAMRCAVVFCDSAGARSRSVVHGGLVTVLQRFTTCCNSINHVGRFRHERRSQRAMPLSAWLACCPVVSSSPVLQHRAGCMSLACRVHERHGLKALAELLVAMYMARCRAQHVAAATTAEPPFAFATNTLVAAASWPVPRRSEKYLFPLTSGRDSLKIACSVSSRLPRPSGTRPVPRCTVGTKCTVLQHVYCIATRRNR